jgi:hypothetical protein
MNMSAESSPKTKNMESFEKLLDKAEHQELLTEHAEHAGEAENTAEQTTRKLVEARQTVEATAATNNPLEDLKVAEAASAPAQPRTINRELKQITLQRELLSLRRKLAPPQRTLSRVIHQPVIRVVSEAAGRTVTRPSGLLGGSLVAFLGTSGYLFLAKYLGFTYNYSIFLFLFAAGFAFGLGLELLVQLAMVSRRRAD